jgi:hypothetical protein
MIVNMKGGLRLPRIFGYTPAGKAKLQKCIDFVEQEVNKAVKSGVKTFSVQTLFGGDNYNWCALGYPIGDLWTELRDKYEDEGYSDPDYQAVHQAGIYVGYIMKYVCHRMTSAKFEMERTFTNIKYTVV